jgi:hypothetical protein
VQAAVTSGNPAALLQHAAPPDLNREEIARYSRHLIMPEVGVAGQRELKAASIWLIGAGGRCGTHWSGRFRCGRLQELATSSHSRNKGCGTAQAAIGQLAWREAIVRDAMPESTELEGIT